MQPTYTSFTELSHAEFIAHAEIMLSNSKRAEKKREAAAYLQSTAAQDKKILDEERRKSKTRRLAQREREKTINELLNQLSFDFSKSPELFTAQTLSDADMATMLTQDSKTVFIGGKAFAGDLVVSGSGVTVDGEGSGSAVAQTLTNSATVVGDLIISGDNCTIRNIDFTSATNQAVRVAGASNLTIENCKFSPGAGLSDTKWFYGAGIQTGDLTIKNCRVSDFDSWYLMDASTTSAAATVRLDQVRIKNNFFKNNAGSIAICGPVADPNKSVVVSGNTFETATFHQYFWDFVEVSGATKRVVIRDNACVGEPGTHTAAGKKGGFQVWSKSPRPWTLDFRGNAASNLKVFLKIAHNAGFYSPDTSDEDHRIEFDATLTDVAFAFSPVYKKADGTTASENKWQEGDYVPENAAVYPSPPSVVNPSNYSVVQPS